MLTVIEHAHKSRREHMRSGDAPGCSPDEPTPVSRIERPPRERSSPHRLRGRARSSRFRKLSPFCLPGLVESLHDCGVGIGVQPLGYTCLDCFCRDRVDPDPKARQLVSHSPRQAEDPMFGGGVNRSAPLAVNDEMEAILTIAPWCPSRIEGSKALDAIHVPSRLTPTMRSQSCSSRSRIPTSHRGCWLCGREYRSSRKTRGSRR